MSRSAGSARMRSTKVKPSMPGISTSHRISAKRLRRASSSAFLAGACDIDLVAGRFEDALLQHPRRQRIVDHEHRPLCRRGGCGSAAARSVRGRHQTVRIEDQLRIAFAVERGADDDGAGIETVGQRAHDGSRRAEQALDADGGEAIRRRRRRSPSRPRPADQFAPSSAAASGMNGIALPLVEDRRAGCGAAMSPAASRTMRRTPSSGSAIAPPPLLGLDHQRRHRGDRPRNDKLERRAAAGLDAHGDFAAEPLQRLAHDVEADAAAGHVGHRRPTC